MSSVTKLTGSGKVDTASAVLRAFAHPLRIKLLSYINNHGKINVNKIYGALNLEQSITSQHLRILRDAGLVNSEREGKFIFYSLNYTKIDHIGKSVKNFLDTQ